MPSDEPGFWNRTDTTSVVIRGARNVTGDFADPGELARRTRRRPPSRDRVGGPPRTGRADLAGKPRRFPPRRSTRRSGRLSGDPVLLGRIIGRDDTSHPGGRRTPCRRSLSISRPPARGRRRARGARPSGTVLRARVASELDRSPVQLIAGGSGVVPLFAMAAARELEEDAAEFRLLYSVRTPEDVFFAKELYALSKTPVHVAYTRRSPPASLSPPGRLTRESVAGFVFPATATPRIFVCGPHRSSSRSPVGFSNSAMTPHEYARNASEAVDDPPRRKRARRALRRHSRHRDHRRDRTMRRLSSHIRTRTRPRLRDRHGRGPAMRTLPGRAAVIVQKPQEVLVNLSGLAHVSMARP